MILPLLREERTRVLKFLIFRQAAQGNAVERLNLCRFSVTPFMRHPLCKIPCLNQDKLVVRQGQGLSWNRGRVAPFTGYIRVWLVVHFEHWILEPALPISIDTAPPIRRLFLGQLPFSGSIAFSQGFGDRRKEWWATGLQVELSAG